MYYYLPFLFWMLSACVLSQNQNTMYSIAFYNVENLYDTKRDKKIDDTEFTSGGAKKWTKSKYQKKINNIAYAISLMGKGVTPSGAAIIGLAEVENRTVLEDLVNSKSIISSNYKIIHADSPDKRGSDVALLYNPVSFKAKGHKIYPYKSAANRWLKSRDILLVYGELAGESLHIIVNHWPSRRGEGSGEQREVAAAICKHIQDSIYRSDPKAKIVIMGDMNDNPFDKSCRIILNAKKNESEVKPGGLYNTMWALLDKGIGSYRYRNKWHMYDQIIISQSLIDKNSRLKYIKPEVFNPDFLIQQKGSYKGYPFRSFSGNTFINGYSDHFPILIYLKYEKK